VAYPALSRSDWSWGARFCTDPRHAHPHLNSLPDSRAVNPAVQTLDSYREYSGKCTFLNKNSFTMVPWSRYPLITPRNQVAGQSVYSRSIRPTSHALSQAFWWSPRATVLKSSNDTQYLQIRGRLFRRFANVHPNDALPHSLLQSATPNVDWWMLSAEASLTPDAQDQIGAAASMVFAYNHPACRSTRLSQPACRCETVAVRTRCTPVMKERACPSRR